MIIPYTFVPLIASQTVSTHLIKSIKFRSLYSVFREKYVASTVLGSLLKAHYTHLRLYTKACLGVTF